MLVPTKRRCDGEESGIDQIDRHLLELLRADARTSMAELGRLVGLSRTATLARVRALEASGAIRGYHADVDPAPDAGHVARVAVMVRTTDPKRYIRRLLAVPEVTAAESVAGDWDLLVRIAAPTSARLDELLDRIASWRETVRTTTFVILREHRQGGPESFTHP